MAFTKIVLLTFVLAVFVSTVAAQFGGFGLGGGIGSFGSGFGGKPGKPGFGGLGGLGGFGGKPGLGGFGGKPGKPGGSLLGGGLFDLYRFQSRQDIGRPFYYWEPVPTYY